MPVHAVPTPFDLWATMATVAVGTRVHDAWVWTTTTEAGAGTIELSMDGGAVRSAAWGDGADALVGRVPWLIGGHDDGWRAVPAELRDLWARRPGLRLGSNRAVYETIATTVIGQVVTTREAKTTIRRLVAAMGPSGHGPHADVRGFPPAASISDLDSSDLHPFGLERRRAEILIEVARRSNRLEQALDMDAPAAERRIQAVRGVGPWTSGIAMGAAYGSTDAIPIGDYHLPHAVAWALAGEDRADDDRMVELLEPYRPHRRRVIQMIKQAGIHAPKYGPRTAPRNHM